MEAGLQESTLPQDRRRPAVPTRNAILTRSPGESDEQRLNIHFRSNKGCMMMGESYSNAFQLSPIERCLAEDPAEELKDLAQKLVEMPKMWSPPQPQS